LIVWLVVPCLTQSKINNWILAVWWPDMVEERSGSLCKTVGSRDAAVVRAWMHLQRVLYKELDRYSDHHLAELTKSF